MSHRTFINFLSTCLLAIVVFGALSVIFSALDGESAYSAMPVSTGVIVSMVLLFSIRYRKKNYYYFMQKKGEINMQVFQNLIGKNVVIKTLDEEIIGVLRETNDNFIVVERQKRDKVEQTYVNVNAIQTIKIK